MINNLDVYLWGARMGNLVEYNEGYSKKICFYYDRDFISLGVDPSPLYNSINEDAAKLGLPLYGSKDCGGLPPFIADSLPDRWGNKLFDAWRKAKGLKSKDISSLDKLAYIGKRGMGALEFLPPKEPMLESAFKLNMSDLFVEAPNVEKQARVFKVGDISNLISENLIRIGTSAGGKRPKAIVNYNPVTGEFYSGQVPAPEPGYLPMLIKFQENIDFPSTRVEYAFYLMAQDAGMKMMPSQLFVENGYANFLTERFDRNGDDKLHVLTLSAMNPNSDSYEDLFTVATKLNLPSEGLNNIYRNMVLNVICGNVDDHNKNFSFVMDKSGRWRVAPAYDFTYSIDPSAPAYVNRHSLSICGKTYDITIDDLDSIAERFCVKNHSNIISDCVAAALNFETYAQEAEVNANWKDLIVDDIKQRLTNMGVDAPSKGYKL